MERVGLFSVHIHDTLNIKKSLYTSSNKQIYLCLKHEFYFFCSRFSAWIFWVIVRLDLFMCTRFAWDHLIGPCVTYKRQSKFSDRKTRKDEILLQRSWWFQTSFDVPWTFSQTFLRSPTQPQPQTSSLQPWINDAFSTYTFPLVLLLTQT